MKHVLLITFLITFLAGCNNSLDAGAPSGEATGAAYVEVASPEILKVNAPTPTNPAVDVEDKKPETAASEPV